jgi:CDP-diacylglycerol--serine O-phosphatidyltransferase
MRIVGRKRESVAAPKRPKRLRSIAFLPSLFTLANLFCGFGAIHFGLQAMQAFGEGVPAAQDLTGNSTLLDRMLPSFLSVGAGLIIIGMIFDLFDGLLARMTRMTTNFGGQLDSLADVVTCGVAPAVLLIVLMMQELHREPFSISPVSEHIMGRLIWVSAGVYLACAAVRLARFNVEHAEVGYDHQRFRGLPSPGAAGIIAAFLIFQEQAREYGVRLPGDIVMRAIPTEFVAYVAPLLAIAVSLLMVSRVPYGKVTAVLRGRRPFGQLILVILLFAVFWSFKTLFVLLFAAGYVLSGPVLLVVRRFRGKPKTVPTIEPEEDERDVRMG